MVVIVVAAGGVFLFKEILVLQLGNTDSLQRIHVRIVPPERFSITYLHSIYGEPVTEEFEAAQDGIVLQGVRTKSSAVREYYRFEEAKEFHRVHVKLGARLLRVGEGEGQTLKVGDRMIRLTDLGKRGDRIGVSIRSISTGEYLLTKLREVDSR